MRVGEDKTTGAREAKRINVMMADMLLWFFLCADSASDGDRKKKEGSIRDT